MLSVSRFRPYEFEALHYPTYRGVSGSDVYSYMTFLYCVRLRGCFLSKFVLVRLVLRKTYYNGGLTGGLRTSNVPQILSGLSCLLRLWDVTRRGKVLHADFALLTRRLLMFCQLLIPALVWRIQFNGNREDSGSSC